MIHFSRSNRHSILTVDLVVAMTDTFQAQGAMPQKTTKCLNRIKKRIKAIQRIMYGGSKLVMSPGSYRQYARIIKSIGRIIDSIADDTLDLDFINAVLVLVEDTRESCKRSKNFRLQREWEFLNQSLATLYGHVDPELDKHNWMVLGDNLAGRFKQIMVG